MNIKVLKGYLAENDITLKKLSEITGISVSTCFNVMNSKNCTIDTFLKIVNALDLPKSLILKIIGY